MLIVNVNIYIFEYVYVGVNLLKYFKSRSIYMYLYKIIKQIKFLSFYVTSFFFINAVYVICSFTHTHIVREKDRVYVNAWYIIQYNIVYLIEIMFEWML